MSCQRQSRLRSSCWGLSSQSEIHCLKAIGDGPCGQKAAAKERMMLFRDKYVLDENAARFGLGDLRLMVSTWWFKPVPVKTGISLTTSLAQTAPGMVLKPRQPSSLVSSQALSAFKPRQQSSVVRSQASSAVIPRQQSFLVSSQASSGAKPPQRSSIVSSQASSAVKPRLGPPGRGRGREGEGGGAHTDTYTHDGSRTPKIWGPQNCRVCVSKLLPGSILGPRLRGGAGGGGGRGITYTHIRTTTYTHTHKHARAHITHTHTHPHRHRHNHTGNHG